MKIRSAARPGASGAAGDQFIAVDDMENKLGSCRIDPFERGETMPGRSYEIRISASGEGSAVHQLLGTALTRAMVMARDSGVNARIFAECAPEDEHRLELYASVGLINDDALVWMSRRVTPGPIVARLPERCVLIEDDLSDPKERLFFLERQEKLFCRENPEKWLQELDKKRLLRRLLLVAREGLVGELVCWSEKGVGVIGVIYTAPDWRRKGAGLYLMEAARQYFSQMRLKESRIEVRLKQTALVRMAAAAGYRQSRVLMRLPGMNLDAPSRRSPY